MKNPDKRAELTIALALLGVVLFSKPILAGFEAAREHFLLGIPALYLYLFVAWGVLIALLALAVESANGKARGSSEPTAKRPNDGPGGD